MPMNMKKIDIYKGTEPNNYITFNEEDAGWRIISIESDNTIKIMRNDSIGQMEWDNTWDNTADEPTWSIASLNNYLNSEYWNALTDQEQVVSHKWSAGVVASFGNDDLANQIASENETIWTGNIGLITTSDYLRANTKMSECGTQAKNNEKTAECSATNWMSSIIPFETGMWTITGWRSYSNPSPTAFVYVIFEPSGTEDIGNIDTNASKNDDFNTGTLEVMPSVYLNSSITLSGTGTQSDPYVIIN